MLPDQPHPGMQMQNRRAKADELRKAGEYVAAAEAYAAVWPDGDPWTGWGLAFCLRKLKRSREALAVANDLLQLSPDFEYGRSVYGWAVYDLIRECDELTVEIAHHAQAVIDQALGSASKYQPVNPFVPIVLRAAKLYANKGKYAQVLQLLQHLQPDLLGTEEFAVTDAKGRERKLASQWERYQGLRTGALEKLGRWEECLIAAELAMSSCVPLHHDNDVWFARRAARSKIHLGRENEGMTELSALAARKPTAFIYHDIADAEWTRGNLDKAFSACVLALRAKGEIAYKLPALLLMTRILWAQGRHDEARRHLSLYMSYRKSREWRVPGVIMGLASEWGVGDAAEPVGALMRELEATWRNWESSQEERSCGVVDGLLPHGRAGFIRSIDHQRYYFDTRDWADRHTTPRKGARVSFAKKPSYDRKRNRSTVVACNIRAELGVS